ncbi:MAG TPA: hypothetical protein VJA94_19330 [Candidatus Angelobacter sp.]
MPVVLETGPPVKPTKASGFWKRQYELLATGWQIAFDLTFGVFAPIICLYMDPGIFRWSDLPGNSLLSHFSFFAYLEIGIGIVALSFFLITHRASLFLAGVLYAGAIFSVAVGIMIFPLTIVAIFALIGLLGLTPFFTAFVFLRNARRCWFQAIQSRAASAFPIAVLAATLTLVMPLLAQLEIFRITSHALVMLQSGTDQEADRAIHTLKLTRFAINTDRLAIAYGNTDDKKQRERLARAFHEITGGKIADRLADLND